jgi:electron transport complex protein RnfB
MTEDPYRRLAERLDALPNGFPPTEDGAELRLLAKLFSPEEAALAAQLRLTLETPEQVAERIGGDARELRKHLKSMAKRGLVNAGRAGRRLGYGLLPFAIGIYEMQFDTIDAELAELFEDYYQSAPNILATSPPLQRVIPVGESVRVDLEVRPYESAAEIVANAKAWGVQDCICRRQKALIGDPCDHPMDVCMIMSQTPGAFDRHGAIRALTQEEAMATLRRAADAGLVACVGNNQEGLWHIHEGLWHSHQGLWYICNCCTCSCGLLRAIADLGISNVVARSAFVCQVEDELCIACGLCLDRCQFDALELDEVVRVDPTGCVGCGLCVPTCPEKALTLLRRPDDQVVVPPETEKEWLDQRAAARGLDLSKVV